jgi:2-oxo-4-hydroxy-4-carboxy-5-ureidoimidazoline decarboxylase
MAVPEGLGLAQLNALEQEQAEQVLLACCSSAQWASRVAVARPFASPDELYDVADAAVGDLSDGDLDDALSGHPRIGERVDGERGAWSRREQSGIQAADARTLEDMAAANRAYEERFGHVYLVCATGRSAGELLGLLRTRLGNDAATERRVLRAELAKINRIRLVRLVEANAA